MLVNANFNDYVLAWSVYLLASVIFLAASWRFLSALKHFGVGVIIMMIIVPAVLMPWPVDESTRGMLAPAWIVAGLDRITNAQDGALRAGVPLVMAIIFSAAISILIVAIKAAFFAPVKPKTSRPPNRTSTRTSMRTTARTAVRTATKTTTGKPNAASVSPVRVPLNRELENTLRKPRESLAAPPKPKAPTIKTAAKSTGRIEPRISDAGMNQLETPPKPRR